MDLTAGKAVSILKRVDKDTRALLSTPKTESGANAATTANGSQLIREAKDALDQSLRDTVDLSPGTGVGLSDRASDLLGEMSEKMQPLLSLIDGALGRQNGLKGVAQAGENASLDDLRKAFGVEGGVPDDVQKKAQELLDTYFSVEETSERIFSFAFSFYNGSEDRAAYAERFGSYIDEGFRQAEKQLGGLAEISIDTYKAIKEKINDFVGEDGDGETDTAASEDAPSQTSFNGTYNRGGNLAAGGAGLDSLLG